MAFQGAQNVTEAAYNQFAVFEQNIWKDGASFADIYVNRTSGGISPFQDLKDALIHARDPITIFVTGQKGSGKSMELRRLHDDGEIAGRFERVSFVVTDWLAPLNPGANIQDLLLSLSAALAEHVTSKGYDKHPDWKDSVGKPVAKWAEILKHVVKPEAPGMAEDFKLSIKLPLVELSTRLRDDLDLRQRVLKDDNYSVTALGRLVSDLTGAIGKLSGKPALLTIDDGDKLAGREAATNIFLQHFGMLTRLPCWTVITFPYWLHFHSEWNTVATLYQTVLLHNVKVVNRNDQDEPRAVLPVALGFFRLLYSKLVDAGADLVDQAALDEAIRLSAGIPREFVRVLQRGFAIASIQKQPRLTGAILERSDPQAGP